MLSRIQWSYLLNRLYEAVANKGHIIARFHGISHDKLIERSSSWIETPVMLNTSHNRHAVVCIVVCVRMKERFSSGLYLLQLVFFISVQKQRANDAIFLLVITHACFLSSFEKRRKRAVFIEPLYVLRAVHDQADGVQASVPAEV
jgi:hypothetical protein